MFKDDLQKKQDLVDSHGRKINYLRLSVTDRCNLRCSYCAGWQEQNFLPHKEILTYEEFLDLIQVAWSLGVTKLRLTGGEPFVRKDFLQFLARIVENFPGLDLRITSNGTLLRDKVKALQELGLRGLNISLDTLQPAKFQHITGRDLFHEVRENIAFCLEQGLHVKINVVAMRGVNDQELEDFLLLAQNNPLDLRFIEFMPLGRDSGWAKSSYWSAADILQELSLKVQLRPLARKGHNHGPARMYALQPGQGRIGIISPLSQHFCSTCNRFRITSDGRLRTCLFSDKEYKLKPILRSPRFSLQQVYKIMEATGARKPLGHNLLQAQGLQRSVCQRAMSSIGG